MLLAVGVAPWIEAAFTVKWAVPYCSSQVDGPAWPATGFPFPYQVFSGVSSLEYLFMPHVYLCDLAVYAGFLFLALRIVLPVSGRVRRAGGLAGVGLGLFAIVAVFLALNMRTLIPVMNIGDDSYGRYREYRPVGLSVFHHPRECPASDFWFPEGWVPH